MKYTYDYVRKGKARNGAHLPSIFLLALLQLDGISSGRLKIYCTA